MVYYYFICQRKLWYFINEIYMEQNSELVQLGKIIDEETYKRETKGILIDDTINVDFIKDGAVLHEVKKTKAIEEAGIWQLKYYMYYLNKKGVKNIKAKIDYPLLRESLNIEIDNEDIKILENIEKNIEEISNIEKPPAKLNSSICKKCAYYDLCYV
ncbi:MAG: CRISPR-associated protein Cas4 [Clostridia bacterium]|nr:CRISPR-associated protein Cas4 [Clostridia bacterium]